MSSPSPNITGFDHTPLVDCETPSPSSNAETQKCALRSCFSRRKPHCLIVTIIAIILLVLIAVGIAIALYFSLNSCSETNCIQLKVLSLNTWGMPEALGAQKKAERMAAIAKEISRAKYDLYLLEELWMQADHMFIANSIPEGFTITGFRQLALEICDGRALPTYCSGLAIVSRFSFLEVEFNEYSYRGNFAKAFIDGEFFAGKGVGRIRIEPTPNVTVDVFVTHTAADPDPSYGYNNSFYRVRQIWELRNYLRNSNADVIILGGDLNASPDWTPGSVYSMLRYDMSNCIEDIYYMLRKWLDPQFATYGNKRNTFSNMYEPGLFDYIFHRTNSNRTQAWTHSFFMPFFKTRIFEKFISTLSGQEVRKVEDPRNRTIGNYSSQALNSTDIVAFPESKKEEEISLSDHEAVTSTIYMWKAM